MYIFKSLFDSITLLPGNLEWWNTESQCATGSHKSKPYCDHENYSPTRLSLHKALPWQTTSTKHHLDFSYGIIYCTKTTCTQISTTVYSQVLTHTGLPGNKVQTVLIHGIYALFCLFRDWLNPPGFWSSGSRVGRLHWNFSTASLLFRTTAPQTTGSLQPCSLCHWSQFSANTNMTMKFSEMR